MKRILHASICLGLSALPSWAVQRTYSGATDGDWANASNWGGTAPGSGTTLTDTRINVNSNSAGLNYTVTQGTTILDIAAGGGENRGLVIGSTLDSASGLLTITGGTLQLTSEGVNATVLIGAGASSAYAGSAVLNVSGGTLNLPGASSAIGILGRGGAGATGELNISGTGSVLADIVSFGELVAVSSTSATATLNLNGGTLTTRVIFDRNAVANSIVNFNGGLLKSGDTTHGANPWVRTQNGGVSARILAGGAFIDTNGQDNQRIEVGLSGSAGGSLTKLGDGRLVLQGASTYDGATLINAGALRISNATALGNTTGTTTVANNARLELSGGITVTGETVTINGHGGTFSINGSTAGFASGALQAASGNNTWNGTVILGSNNPRVGAQIGGTLNIQGGIVNGTSTDFIVRNDDDGNPIGANRGITTVSTPAGVNTYTGNTDVFRGYLRLGANNTLPTGTTVRLGTSGGTAFFGLLDLNGFSQTVAGVTTGPGATAADQYITNNGTLASTLTVNNAANMTFGGTAKNGSGTLHLTKAGAGTWTLTGINTYTGITTINGGTLRLASGGRIESSSQIIINSGGVLRDESVGIGTIGDGATVTINGGGIFSSNQSEYIGALEGAGSWVFDNTSSSLDMAVTPTGNALFTGTISQTGTQSQHFSKRGTGTQTLSGVNAYRGETRLIQGVLRVTSGNESTLGTPNASGSAVNFLGGTLQVSSNSLTLDDSGRGVFLGLGGGTVEVDPGLSLTIANAISGTNVNLTKVGGGTLNLSGNQTTLGTLTLNSGDVSMLAGARLRVNTINMGGGTLNWGTGSLTHALTVAQEGTTQLSSPGYQDVYVGKSLVVNGNLATQAGSELELHASPTIYLNNGVRFNNLVVNGNLDLSAANDRLEVELNPYLLRPFSPTLGSLASETGSLPLVAWSGTQTGFFDVFAGVQNDGLGFSASTLIGVTDPTTLAINTYALEYDAAAQTLWFHYKVAGYVPEPATFGLMGVGALVLRLARRRVKPA